MTTELITHSLQQWHFVRGRVLVSMHHAASRLCDNGEALRLVQHAQLHYARAEGVRSQDPVKTSQVKSSQVKSSSNFNGSRLNERRVEKGSVESPS